MSVVAKRKTSTQLIPHEIRTRSAGWVLRQTLLYSLLVIGAFISLFPFYFMFMASTLPRDQVLAQPPHLLPGDQLFTNVKRLLDDKSLDLAAGILNSVII